MPATPSRSVLIRLWLAILLVLPVAPSGVLAAERGADLETDTPEAVGLSTERLQRLEDGMQRLVDEEQVAGVVTLLARQGKIVHAHTAGVTNVETGTPVQRDSIFRIFSMTKPVIGAALMMLWEEGAWRLNDPVSTYIPAFGDLQVHVGENADGTLQLEPLTRPMRMRHLMTHTAGLGYVLNPRHPVTQLFIEHQVLDTSQPLQTQIDRMAEVPLVAQPGTRWAYSASIDVQGYLIEQLSGQPLGEFLEQRIFEPLGMVDTGFFVPEDQTERVALQHRRVDGELTLASGRRSRVTTAPPVGPSGGGGLYGTADDYLKFAQLMLNGGELNGVRLLGRRTVEMMQTNHLSAEALPTRGAGQGWGLGFSVVMDQAASGEAWADGSYYWWGIAGTWFWIDPVNDLAFVGMIQHAGPEIGLIHGLSRNWVYQALVD